MQQPSASAAPSGVVVWVWVGAEVAAAPEPQVPVRVDDSSIVKNVGGAGGLPQLLEGWGKGGGVGGGSVVVGFSAVAECLGVQLGNCSSGPFASASTTASLYPLRTDLSPWRRSQSLMRIIRRRRRWRWGRRLHRFTITANRRRFCCTGHNMRRERIRRSLLL